MADNQEPNKTDMFGIAAYGEALNTLAKGAVDGSGAFLSRICLPAAEEYGLLLKDKVSAWRANNALLLTQNAEKILSASNRDNVHAHPRLVMKILTEGSWIDDDQVRLMWSGLLASSCTEDGKDESNIIFLNIMSQMTALQARVIAYACTNSSIVLDEYGLLFANLDDVSLDEIYKITECLDLHRIDRELDHLRSMELIGGTTLGGGGIHSSAGTVDITPTALTLHFNARCNGVIDTVENFYSVDKSTT